ncbi:MAG: VCBS repeat-containing protein, partial [Thermoanaerobaculia bacterium]|nr:VCBS repeat-containing protein [Thermoanaerobaculia bacterium]
MEDPRRRSPDEELRPPGDDAVIGRAVKISLLALAALAAVVAVVYLALSGGEVEAPEVSLEAAAPAVVETEAEAPPVSFTDVTEAAGIDFVHHNGATGEKLLPETMGGGVAFFDGDGDDDPDLFLLNGAPWPHSPRPQTMPASRYYVNRGDGTFQDASRASGLDLTLYGTGVAAGDYDGDGAIDLFVAAVGRNRLLRNAGG